MVVTRDGEAAVAAAGHICSLPGAAPAAHTMRSARVEAAGSTTPMEVEGGDGGGDDHGEGQWEDEVGGEAVRLCWEDDGGAFEWHCGDGPSKTNQTASLSLLASALNATG